MSSELLSVLFLVVTAACLYSDQGSAPSPQAPTGLRCEYLVDPLGIDTPKPRFFWVLEHASRTRSKVPTRSWWSAGRTAPSPMSGIAARSVLKNRSRWNTAGKRWKATSPITGRCAGGTARKRPALTAQRRISTPDSFRPRSGGANGSAVKIRCAKSSPCREPFAAAAPSSAAWDIMNSGSTAASWEATCSTRLDHLQQAGALRHLRHHAPAAQRCQRRGGHARSGLV